MSKIEILAPVGNEEMLRAAVFSGADAVYLGFSGFNARTSANNFNADTLKDAVAFCHARGVAVHVALNTTVYGGELPALVFVDTVGRLCEGVLADESCFTEESHFNGLLEYPQYSRPDEWHGLSVPEVLRSGDHAKVARWQKKQAILRTLHRRPDLFYKLRFPYKTRAERKFIAELEAEDDAFRDRNPKNLDYRK